MKPIRKQLCAKCLEKYRIYENERRNKRRIKIREIKSKVEKIIINKIKSSLQSSPPEAFTSLGGRDWRRLVNMTNYDDYELWKLWDKIPKVKQLRDRCTLYLLLAIFFFATTLLFAWGWLDMLRWANGLK